LGQSQASFFTKSLFEVDSFWRHGIMWSERRRM
jgi:hypothetical protein